MEFTKDQKQNYFNLVGKVSALDIVEGTTAIGRPYIRGSITVNANGSDFKVSFFEMKMWKVGQPDERPNPRIEEINALQNDELVSFSCQLEENKFAGGDGKIISNSQLSLNFINKPKETDELGLTFDIVGVVTRPLEEVRNEKEELVKFSIKIGQAQYQIDRGFSIVELSVDPKKAAAVDYMRNNYTLGKTVRVSGRGVSVIETRIEKTESVFGAAKEEVYQDHKTDYFIEDGLIVSESMNYSQEQIDLMATNTKSFEESLKNAPKKKPKAGTAGASAFEGGAAQSTKDVGSLLGM